MLSLLKADYHKTLRKAAMYNFPFNYKTMCIYVHELFSALSLARSYGPLRTLDGARPVFIYDYVPWPLSGLGSNVKLPPSSTG